LVSFQVPTSVATVLSYNQNFLLSGFLCAHTVPEATRSHIFVLQKVKKALIANSAHAGPIKSRKVVT